MLLLWMLENATLAITDNGEQVMAGLGEGGLRGKKVKWPLFEPLCPGISFSLQGTLAC